MQVSSYKNEKLHNLLHTNHSEAKLEIKKQ